jgi:hypothetical protein
MRKCAGSPPGSGGWHQEVDTGDTSKTGGDGMWVWPCRVGGRGVAVRGMSSWQAAVAESSAKRGGRTRWASCGGTCAASRHTEQHRNAESVGYLHSVSCILYSK